MDCMTQQTVRLAVYDTMADWEYGYAVAAIHNPAYHKESGLVRVVTVGPSREPITTVGGVRIVPDMTIDELAVEDSAILILPGANTWDTKENGAFADAARRFLDAGVPVAAICGATFGLADAGLLDDRQHTSSDVRYLSFSENYHGAALYQDAPAWTDGPLTTAGPANPLDFAKHIIAKLDLYTPEKLDAWYDYYRTGDAAYFYKLVPEMAPVS
jgi:putative intracellular protease/amidase